MVTWTQAEDYEFGRPAPTEVVHALCAKIEKHVPLHEKRILDAGCGSGRICLPIAKKYKDLDIIGIDISENMLNVLKRRLVEQNVSSVSVEKGDLCSIDHDAHYFHATLVSSLLHLSDDWKLMLHEMLRVTKKEGWLLLLSEQGDIYDLVLARENSTAEDLVRRFWEKYIELRRKNGIPDPEDMLPGAKWDLGNDEAVSFLEEQGVVDLVEEVSVTWKHPFTVAQMMDIIERKCYSHMFTADPEAYKEVVDAMHRWLDNANIDREQVVKSTFTMQCDMVKLK